MLSRWPSSHCAPPRRPVDCPGAAGPPPLVRLVDLVPTGLALVGALALLVLVLGLLGVHVVTEHFRLH